ncbi:MAG: carboxypeptidase-like regulatory domain-containing protein [Gemmatimonadota bacterium]|nr:carboxypeptidase-like regulatory domain-containing protein [Gemmatimonadota bacterium]
MRSLRPFVLPALLALLALCSFAAPFRSAVAQGVDIIRGRVTGPENQPLEGAQVTVTTLSGAVSRQARTDQNGRFTVTFPGGDGDYLVTFNSIGYAQRRFEVKRVADEEILIADARMSRTAQALGEVRVQGDRTRPNRNDVSPDIGGSERQINQSALSAAQQGDLAAMAASLPGVLLVPGADGDPSGFSVLGLDPSQNSTTLNGMNFGGSDIPRDAAVSSSLATSPYDVSRGGFSGGNFSLRTQGGTNFKIRTASLNVDAPQMQWTDQAARALGQQYSNLSLSGRLSGPVKYNESFFNLAYQLGRRSNDLQTLLNTGPLGLQTSGIATDSVTRLLGILGGLKVPTVAGQLGNDRITDQGSVLGSFDLAPPSSRAGSAYNVTLVGSWNRMSPVSNLTSEFPAHSGDRTSWNASAQFRHSTYFGIGILSETSVGLSGSQAASDPYLLMPGGTVRVNSTFADGTAGVKNVAFGGNAALNSRTSNQSLAFSNLLSWFSEDSKHRIKVSTELRRDSYGLDQALNQLGTFTFNSLADLQAGRPASYTRTLQPRVRDGDQVVGALSIGDSYRRSNTLQFQYGVRLDGNAFGTKPSYNPQVEQVFGVRNDVVPNDVYVSPRAGFSWSYGTAAQIGGFEGAFRGPRATVRGGIGLFQGTPGVQAIGNAIDFTGLPTGLQQVICTGTAAPVPDWAGYAGGAPAPSQCADGSTGSVFASTVPNVSLFANDYVAPRSVRSNLQWSGAVLGNRFNGQFEVTYSLNLNQPGSLDLNFAPAAQFTLPTEANRPVYVQSTSIVPQTGFIAPGGARVSPVFNHVTESRSDLRSESRQFRASLSPLNFSSAFQWSLSYVYSSVREHTRGFGGNTAGNPLDFQWSRASLDSRHQIQYSLNYNAFDFVRFSWFGSFRSGTPFTPLVAADLNGDGYANDRAFIYGANASDPALGAAMSTLMGSAPSYVRDCLRRQLGAVAGRNSCEGPWTAQANLSISFNPVKVGMPQRANLSFGIQNPLGAADLLLHGDNHLQGWGQNAIPDQNLLYVRGFDPNAKRFIYDVNQRFGSTSPQVTPIRTPVVATAMFRFDIGPTREEQSLTQQLNVGRRTEGSRLPESILRAVYATGGGLANPIAQILRQSDSLQLTSRQADSLATLNRWYVIRLDSIWSPIVKSLAALPNDYDEGEAYRSYKRGREASVDLLRKLAPQVKGLLDEPQQRKLPPLVTSYLDQRYLASIRSGTAGAAGSPFAGLGSAMPMGGGNVQIIIR